MQKSWEGLVRELGKQELAGAQGKEAGRWAMREKDSRCLGHVWPMQACWLLLGPGHPWAKRKMAPMGLAVS